MATVEKRLIIEKLQNNLSPRFKEWYGFERIQNWDSEDIQINLSTLASMILHPPKDNPNVTKVFIEDAKFITEYSLTLGFDEFDTVPFRTLLAEVYIIKGQFNEALHQINLNKSFLETDIETFSYDLEEVSILEWQIYKQLNDSNKMQEVVNKINAYRKARA
jgi:hypothetical protein